MFVYFSSLRFSSLKSFCAPRHTPNVALQTWELVQALGFPNPNGVFFFFAWVLYMDNVSRHTWAASNLPRYITLLSTQTIVSPCGVYGQVSSKQILQNILQKSLLISIFHIYHKKIPSAFQVSKQMFTCKRCKTEWLC